MNFLKIVSIFLLGTAFIYSSWVAKINSDLISTKEFQSYINVKKLGVGQKVSKPIEDPETVKNFLKQYIESKIILKEAKKLGITSYSKSVVKVFENQKEDWVIQTFLLTRIDLNSIDIKEKDLRKYFEEYKKRDPEVNKSITYNKLNSRIKSQLYQALMAEKTQLLKNNYRRELEKKYRVKKNSSKDTIVAVVNGVKVKNSEIVSRLREQLKATGISIDQLKQKRSDYEKAFEIVRDEIILQILVKEEIAKNNFANRNIVKDGLKILMDTVIYQTYIKNEIFDKIKPTEEEKNRLYESEKKNLAKLSFEQTTTYLNNAIKQRKAGVRLENFITEKKEESIIKRNYSELNKIK